MAADDKHRNRADTTTDRNGRYQINGLSGETAISLSIFPTEKQPYFQCDFEVPPTSGIGPTKQDLLVPRGIWITGRVSDRATGKPTREIALYEAYRGNPFTPRPAIH